MLEGVPDEHALPLFERNWAGQEVVQMMTSSNTGAAGIGEIQYPNTVRGGCVTEAVTEWVLKHGIHVQAIDHVVYEICMAANLFKSSSTWEVPRVLADSGRGRGAFLMSWSLQLLAARSKDYSTTRIPFYRQAHDNLDEIKEQLMERIPCKVRARQVHSALGGIYRVGDNTPPKISLSIHTACTSTQCLVDTNDSEVWQHVHTDDNGTWDRVKTEVALEAGMLYNVTRRRFEQQHPAFVVISHVWAHKLFEVVKGCM
ncbi:unnamed protein product [Calypogeia fissa]